MALNLKIFLIFFLIINLLLLISFLKSNKISIKYSMYLLFYFLFFFIIIMFPALIENIASLFGFKETPNMLFLVAIFFLFYLIIFLYTNNSKLNENNKSIIQEMSILMYDSEKK